MGVPKRYQPLVDSIENEYQLDLDSPGLEMLAVFNRDTLRRAKEVQGPGRLRIIHPHELAPRFLAGVGRLFGKTGLCLLIGKRELIDQIKSPEDKQ